MSVCVLLKGLHGRCVFLKHLQGSCVSVCVLLKGLQGRCVFLKHLHSRPSGHPQCLGSSSWCHVGLQLSCLMSECL